MKTFQNILEVYTNDLTIGWLESIEHIDICNPDKEYLNNSKWIFSICMSDKIEYAGNGWWDKIENLIFVDNHDQKIEIIDRMLKYTDKKEFDFKQIVNILTD